MLTFCQLHSDKHFLNRKWNIFIEENSHENVDGKMSTMLYRPHWKWIYKAIFALLSTYICGLAHDDVIKWKHFPRYWPFVREIHRSPVNSPHRGQWRGDLMFSLICAWINKILSKQSWGRRFETLSLPLWRHSNETIWSRAMKLGQNFHHIEEDIFKCIYLNENVCISIKISLKCIPRGLF